MTYPRCVWWRLLVAAAQNRGDRTQIAKASQGFSVCPNSCGVYTGFFIETLSVMCVVLVMSFDGAEIGQGALDRTGKRKQGGGGGQPCLEC